MRPPISSKPAETLAWRARIIIGILCALVVSAITVVNTSAQAQASPKSAWSVVPSANTSSTDNDYLSSVSCVSTTFCMAVGYYTGGTDQTLIESWNGTGWTIVPSPDTSPTAYDVISSVSCVSTTFCMAVGYYTGGTDQTLIESWNGTSWSIVSSPNASPTEPDTLASVSCVASRPSEICTAVGNNYNGTVLRTLIESWNGTGWTIVPSPNTSPTDNDYLTGLSCLSTTVCVAVGNTTTVSSARTLIESWNGTNWSIVPSPNTSLTDQDVLNGVSCVPIRPRTICTAVGYYNNGTDQTLIESWNGWRWSIVPSPNTSTAQLNVFAHVSCESASFCTAVGYDYSGTADQTLIESLNGISWQIVPSPSTDSGILFGISCVSTRSCTATGSYTNANHSQTLVESFTGRGVGSRTDDITGSISICHQRSKDH